MQIFLDFQKLFTFQPKYRALEILQIPTSNAHK